MAPYMQIASELKEKHMDTIERTSTIDQLNRFLRGELAAVESYRLALEKLDDTIYRGTLLECARSHEQRARMLTDAVVRSGGAPVKSSGAWGAFASLIESGASTFGERAAIAALEQGEDRGLQGYRAEMMDLDEHARELARCRLVPEQQQTYESIRNIKRQLAAA